MEHLLAGTTVPLVTVMSAPGVPDAERTIPLLGAMASAGIDNLMLLGSNGEGALLDPSATHDYLVRVVSEWRAVRHGGRVLINVSAAGTGDVIRRATSALDAAPDLLIVSPPSYFHHRDDEIVAHIRALEQFGIPYAIYNVPKYANALTASVFRVLLDDSPTLVGMKDSSGSMDTVREFLELAKTRPGIGLSQGDEMHLTEALAAGAVGIVPGTANLLPGLTVDLYAAVVAGDDDAAERAQVITREIAALHAIRPGVPSVKAVLSNRGYIDDFVAPPLARCSNDERQGLAEFLTPFEPDLIARYPL